MTVTSLTRKVTYIGNASTVDFAFTFKVYSADDIEVYVDNEIRESGYTVSLNEDGTGTVTFDVAPRDTGIVFIRRVTSLTQETDYVENDPFPAEDHENVVDKLTMEVQDAYEEINRKLGFASWSENSAEDYWVPEPVANKVLGWNSDASALINQDNNSAASAASAEAAAASAAVAAGYLSDILGYSADAFSFATLASGSANEAAEAALSAIAADIHANQAGSIEMSDSFGATTSGLSSLYDSIWDTGGITYSGTGWQWIEYDTHLSTFCNGVQVWCGQTTHVYVAVSEDGESWTWLGGNGSHELDIVNGKSRLTEYSSEFVAQTNYWNISAGYNYAFFPIGTEAQYFRLYFDNTSGTKTFYELIFRRLVIAEDIITTTLSAIVSNIGTMIAGELQSAGWTASDGFKIDLTNKDITINKSGDTKFAYDGDTGALSIKGTLEILNGSTLGSIPTSYVEGWAHPTDQTKIDGGDVYAGTVTAYQVGANLIITNQANIDNAVIKEAHIDDLQVSTLKIQDNAVTVPMSAYTATCMSIGSSQYTLQQITVATGGADTMLFASCKYYFIEGTMSIYRDAELLVSELYTTQESHVLMCTDTGTTGTHTYYLKFQYSKFGGSNQICNRLLTALTVKK